MVRKNQIALVLLTLVLMLSIFFIKRSQVELNENENEGLEVGSSDTKLNALSTMRQIINDERQTRILELDSIIASTDKTVDEKNVALEEKRYLNTLSEKEALLEFSVINSGYRDCFVHASDVGVEITVISDEASTIAASKILKEARINFSECEQILVTFKTLEEVNEIN